MSFWAFIAILSILGIMIGALYISKIATMREQELQDKRRRVRNLRTDLIDVDELIGTLQFYDRNPDLLSAMVNHMEQIIRDGLELLPDDDSLKQDLEKVAQLRVQINELRETPQDPAIPTTDRQIFLIKKHFGRTIKTLRQLQNSGDLSELDYGNHHARLVRQSLMLEVEAYRQHGLNAKRQGELNSAANFFKHAKDLIIHTDLKFPGKSEEIKRVSREISNLYVTMPDEEGGTGTPSNQNSPR